MLSASFAHNSARDQAEATAPMPARKVLREQIMAHLGVNNREHGCRIKMTIETIGMQVHRVVALVAELSLVLVALAATAQRDLVPDSLPHSFVPEFPEKDPVVLPHPAEVANAALGGIGETSRNGFGAENREAHAKRPTLYANGDRMMTPATTGKSHACDLFGFTDRPPCGCRPVCAAYTMAVAR